MAALAEDADAEAATVGQGIGSIDFLQIVIKGLATEFEDGGNDEFRILAGQQWQSRADNLSLAAKEGGIIDFKVDIRDFLLKSDFENLIEGFGIHGRHPVVRALSAG